MECRAARPYRQLRYSSALQNEVLDIFEGSVWCHLALHKRQVSESDDLLYSDFRRT